MWQVLKVFVFLNHQRAFSTLQSGPFDPYYMWGRSSSSTKGILRAGTTLHHRIYFVLYQKKKPSLSLTWCPFLWQEGKVREIKFFCFVFSSEIILYPIKIKWSHYVQMYKHDWHDKCFILPILSADVMLYLNMGTWLCMCLYITHE